jgi:serine/threonine protein kinase
MTREPAIDNPASNDCPSVADLRRLVSAENSAQEEKTLLQHLDVCPACRSALEEAAGGTEWLDCVGTHLRGRELEPQADAPDSSPDGSSVALLPLADRLGFLAPSDDPRMLGRMGVYEICGVVGHGAMGVVLKAWEPALHRYVALKVLWPHLAVYAPARQRFARESRAAAAVVHDHVVPIYAVDEFRGIPYIVLRYVPGRSLQERIQREGRLEIDEILRIGRQIALGLDAAHSQGLIHRDVKPANILLENTVERVMVTDFGLARTADEASLTHSGLIAGTPQFMAPEQARGEPLDQRSDLFSLGSVLYTMAAGHPPFRAETVVGVIHHICATNPRSVRSVNPLVPDWLDELILKLMDKDPRRRIQTAAELACILEGELAHRQSPSTNSRPRREWSRHWNAGRLARTNLGLLAGGLLIAVTITLAVKGLWWRKPDQNAIPVGASVPTAANPSQMSNSSGQSSGGMNLPPSIIPETVRIDAWSGGGTIEIQSLHRWIDAIERGLVSPMTNPPILDDELRELSRRLLEIETALAQDERHGVPRAEQPDDASASK